MSKPESKPDDGGAAFPVSRGHFAPEGKMLSADWMPGMSLLDWFAGQALMSMLASPEKFTDKTPSLAAELSYKVGRAMIAERQKGGSDGS